MASYPFNTPKFCSSDSMLLINLAVFIFRMLVMIRPCFFKQSTTIIVMISNFPLASEVVSNCSKVAKYEPSNYLSFK